MPSKSDTKGPNIILIVLDTLGTEHMSCYGYSRETCPRMTKYAQKGVLFENAYANDVPTHPSFYSIFSGQRGITTGVVSHDRLEIPVLGTPWFPEILSQNGIVTAAVSTLFTFMRGKEFCRGFYYAVNPEHRGRKERLVDPEAGKRGGRRVYAEETNLITLPLLKRLMGESQGYREIYCNQGLHQASRMIRRVEWKFIDIIERGEWGPGSAYEL